MMAGYFYSAINTTPTFTRDVAGLYLDAFYCGVLYQRSHV